MAYSFAKLFGTETLFDTTKTGLTGMQLIVVSKSSDTVRADL